MNRDELILNAMPDAKLTALRFRGMLDPDEAVSLAYCTLVEIAPRFDPARGVTFWTFARPRIIGTLKDQMRLTPLVNGGRGLEHMRISVEITPELIRTLPERKRESVHFSPLRRALARLTPQELRFIRVFANAPGYTNTHNGGAAARGERCPYEELGIKKDLYWWRRRNILRKLRVHLKVRGGVSKASDIL